MIEVGRLIVKLAGRDADKKGIVIDILDNNHVLIDGQVRRRKCNMIHIEPLNKIIKIPKQATHEEVVKALKAEKIEVKVKKSKDKQKTEKPKKQRKSKKKEPEQQEKTKSKGKEAKIKEKIEIEKKK